MIGIQWTKNILKMSFLMLGVFCSGRKCRTDDYECQCMKLMKPVNKPDRNAMKSSVETCAAENGFDLPERPGK